MQGDPDSTQTNGPTSNLKENRLVRFIKPNVGEVSDLMPVENEMDPRLDNLEPPQFFVRTFNTDGGLKSEIPLKKYAPVYVGRAIGCQIDLVEPSISRRHCVFQYKDLIVDSFGQEISGFMIYDLKSSHGTFLNGARIPSMENIKLNHGDKITLGQCNTEFVFCVASDASEASQERLSPVNANETENHREEADETLTQQPSSTSQATEIDASASKSDAQETWLSKYIKILNNLADAAKEYEEYGIPLPNFDMESRFSKKFKLEHTKLIKQAQTVADLLGQIGCEDSSEIEVPVKKRRKRKEKVIEVDAPPKRGRKSQKNEENIEEQSKNLAKKKRRRAAHELNIQNSTEENETTPLVQTRDPFVSTSLSVMERYQRPSCDGIASVVEQDPLAIDDTNGPKIEEMYENLHESDEEMSNELETTQEVTQNEIVDEREKEKFVEPPPKKRGRKKKESVDITSSSISEDSQKNSSQKVELVVKEKKRRGRQPKEKKEVKENTKAETTAKKPGRKPRNTSVKEKLSPPPRQRRSKKSETGSPKKSTPLKPIDNNSPKKTGRPRKTPCEKSPSSSIIAINAPNTNYESLGLKLKQPIVLLRKLNILTSKHSVNDPLEI